MPTPVGSKLGMLRTVDEWDLQKGMEVEIVSIARNKHSELMLDVKWYAEGATWAGYGLSIHECVILSTPDGRVLHERTRGEANQAPTTQGATSIARAVS